MRFGNPASTATAPAGTGPFLPDRPPVDIFVDTAANADRQGPFPVFLYPSVMFAIEELAGQDTAVTLEWSFQGLAFIPDTLSTVVAFTVPANTKHEAIYPVLGPFLYVSTAGAGPLHYHARFWPGPFDDEGGGGAVTFPLENHSDLDTIHSSFAADPTWDYVLTAGGFHRYNDEAGGAVDAVFGPLFPGFLFTWTLAGAQFYMTSPDADTAVANIGSTWDDLSFVATTDGGAYFGRYCRIVPAHGQLEIAAVFVLLGFANEAVTNGATIVRAPNEAPIPALLKGSWASWIDDVANDLVFDVKYESGAVKRGRVPLV